MGVLTKINADHPKITFFETEKIDGPIMFQVCEDNILPWCKENGLGLLIMDNDPKLHSKTVCSFMKENYVQIYPRGGKTLG